MALFDTPSYQPLQSICSGRFANLTVLGSLYRRSQSYTYWCFAVLTERNANVRIYWISAGELPEHLVGDHRKGVLQALRLWESYPGSSKTMLSPN